MKRRALVTGATGYVGSKLCQRLLIDGWEVDVLTRKAGRQLGTTLAGSVTSHTYDGSTESVLTAVTESKPDVVFHLASLFIAEHRRDQVTDLIVSNVLYGTQLIEACVRQNVKYLVNTGTSWQHWRSDTYDPVCLYAATKQAFEDILKFYTDSFPLRAITLKLFDTYGPEDTRPKLIGLLLNALKTGEHLGLSPGEQKLDLVYVDDVTRSFLVAAEQLLSKVSAEKHERYAVSSHEYISVRNLVALMEDISGKTLNVTFGDRPYRDREVMYPWKAERVLPKWKAEVDVRAGLSRLINLGE
ncbi:NAD-dependent epimerase/dehydratase family protein [Stutzerimonas nitrititolerans]|uniref:NAD-dependent epimerase/dehydratase family protein n=1 Tax=Stutzerimonas nitrititolerans TaxID=2482751 RepID=UPI0028ABB323|nr:NAD(P)-dependent oxidoreductase [Stutzerimonas nitrititolerans]